MAGDPTLFGKIWTYEELQTVERPGRRKTDTDHHKAWPDRLDSWPPSVTVDRENRWVYWLPEGWAQCNSVTVSGKNLKCYMSPVGKRFFHKKDIEKFLGAAFVDERKEAEGEEKAPKKVTDPDAIPSWPDGDWLPRDWRVCYRQLPTKTHKIFIPPGQDEGFCYHRSTVENYLAGNCQLSLFGTSKPMAEISAMAAKKEEPSHKKKRKLDVPTASLDDYEEADWLSLRAVPPHDPPEALGRVFAGMGAAHAEDLVRACGDVRSLLLRRGFLPDLELLAFIRQERSQKHWLSKPLCGVYFRLPTALGGRPCYQKVRRVHHLSPPALCCEPMYIFWSEQYRRWKVGLLDDGLAGWAISSDDKTRPTEISTPWLLLKEEICKKE